MARLCSDQANGVRLRRSESTWLTSDSITGDACNYSTFLFDSNSLTVEEYRAQVLRVRDLLNSLACATYTADAIRRHGAIPSLELSHSGMFVGTYMTDKDRQKSIAQWSASACTRADGVEIPGTTVICALGQRSRIMTIPAVEPQGFPK